MPEELAHAEVLEAGAEQAVDHRCQEIRRVVFWCLDLIGIACSFQVNRSLPQGGFTPRSLRCSTQCICVGSRRTAWIGNSDR